jgi:hypothetical protein
MSQLLYFIEHESVGSQSLYESLGLAYAKLSPYRPATRGPGDVAGIVAGVSSEGLGFFGEQQEWHDFGERNGRRVWCGWFRDAKPGPADLDTDHALPGHQVRLFDDRDWLVPTAVQFADGAFGRALPAAVRMNGAGELSPGEVKPRYSQLWSIASDFWERFHGARADGEGVRFTLAEANQQAVDVLAVNYRLSIREAYAFGLFDDQFDTALRVLKAAIDWPTFVEWTSKKKAGEPPGE